MPVDAHNLTTDIARMDDDGNPPRSASSAATPRLAHASPGGRAAAANDWYRRLGASHRRRDESARLSARAIQERDEARQLTSHRRWPAIVDAMRTLIGCYNDGAGEEALILVDGPNRRGADPVATVTARGGRTLVLAVEGADLWVRASQDEDGTERGERWIGLNRTDEATAGYVLQNWLAQSPSYMDSQRSLRTAATAANSNGGVQINAVASSRSDATSRARRSLE